MLVENVSNTGEKFLLSLRKGSVSELVLRTVEMVRGNSINVLEVSLDMGYRFVEFGEEVRDGVELGVVVRKFSA